MLAVAWICSLFIMLRLYMLRPSIIRLYSLSWGLLIVNYYIGPLSYPYARISASSVIGFISPILFFTLGYITMYLSVSDRIALSRDLRISTEIKINRIGSIFSLSWVIGGLIYAMPFISSLDLYTLRMSFVEGERGVSLFSQIGSILSGFSWLIIARIAIDKGTYSLFSAKVTLLSALLIPIIMAGRQIYFQLIVMVVIGHILSRKRGRVHMPRLLDTSKLIKQAAIAAVVLISAVTLIRFAGENLVYATKVDQFSAISNAELNPSYGDAYGLVPTWVSDLFIEFDYYFSAQLVSFLERFSAIGAPVIDFRVLEKSPFLRNNINKFCSLAQIACFDSAVSTFVGSISDSAWTTVFGTNFQLFGIVGTLFVTALFGAICSLSQCAYNSTPKNFIAGNFLLANSVVAFYSIMDSIFNEVYFMVYYLLSFGIFIRSVKLRPRTRRQHPPNRELEPVPLTSDASAAHI